MNIRNNELYINFKHTYVYLLFLMRKRMYWNVVVNKKTKIVVEGYPRSANTFAFNIFKRIFLEMGVSPKRIAHHTHSAAQIIYGAKRNIPMVVVIRDPLSAVTSLIIMNDLHRKDLSGIADLYLKQYISFHEKIIGLRDKYILADFNMIINNYNHIITEVNEKYKVKFNLLNQDPNEQEAILETIKNDTLKRFKNDHKKLSIPSKDKSNYKEVVNPIVKDSKYFNEAYKMFELISSM